LSFSRRYLLHHRHLFGGTSNGWFVGHLDVFATVIVAGYYRLLDSFSFSVQLPLRCISRRLYYCNAHASFSDIYLYSHWRTSLRSCRRASFRHRIGSLSCKITYISTLRKNLGRISHQIIKTCASCMYVRVW